MANHLPDLSTGKTNLVSVANSEERGHREFPFFLGILLPSLLALVLFITTLLVLVLPAFENGIMNQKREMLRELTRSIWSLLEEYSQEASYSGTPHGRIEAKKLAADHIEQIRYGKEGKDYFWIIDTVPRMVMHPYRSELDSLADYEDSMGERLFMEALETVSKEGEGFIEYMWQWKDDSTRVVSKLSYVKGFEPWGWIVGTGVYLDDVEKEIRSLRSDLLRASLGIALLIALLIAFIVKKSRDLELRRREAEERLRLSREKYKSLVDASMDGTLMAVEGQVTFANGVFEQLAGYVTGQCNGMALSDLFPEITDSAKPFETYLKTAEGQDKEVVASISFIEHGGRKAQIWTVKELSAKRRLELDSEGLSEELRTSLLLMNQPIRPYLTPLPRIDASASAEDAARKMTKKGEAVLFVESEGRVIGLIDDMSLRARLLAGGRPAETPVMEIMSSPLEELDRGALLYEALLRFEQPHLSAVAVRNEMGELAWAMTRETLSNIQRNTFKHLLKAIASAETLKELRRIYDRLPALVHALVESGDRTENITHVISSISDAMVVRIIGLCLEEMSPPPRAFAFMVMGSEGRMEQTLSTDQDNAIVYAGPTEPEVQGFFLELGKKICDGLNFVGYRYCEGNNMAQNPEYNLALVEWKAKFRGWIHDSTPENVLKAAIFFDFRCVHGDAGLVRELRDDVSQALSAAGPFFYHMAEAIEAYRSPEAIPPKRLETGFETLDLKKAMVPITYFIRIYALREGLTETRSLDRLMRLEALGVFTPELRESLGLYQGTLMKARFQSQARDILKNVAPGNLIMVRELAEMELETMRRIHEGIGELKARLRRDFRIGQSA